MKNIVARIRWNIMDSNLFYLTRRFFKINDSWRKKSLSTDSDILIEGFPRSANTYLKHTLLELTNDKIKIASHRHHPLQFYFANKYKIPSVLLYRDPLSCALSYMVKYELNDPSLLNIIFRRYYKFYKTVLNNYNYDLVIKFEDIIGNTINVSNVICGMIDNVDIVRGDLVNYENVENRIKIAKEIREKGRKDFVSSIALPNKLKDSLKNELRHSLITDSNERRLAFSIFYKLEDLNYHR